MDAGGNSVDILHCATVLVGFHFEAETSVQIKPIEITKSLGIGGQIEITLGHRGELVAVDAHPRGVVSELDSVDCHRIRGSGRVHFHCRVEAVEQAGVRPFGQATAQSDRHRAVAVAFDIQYDSRVVGINAAALAGQAAGLVQKGAPLKGDPFHLPQFDMLREDRVVSCKQVVVIYGEGAVLERRHIVRDAARRCGVCIGVDLHGAAVVGEVRAVGDDDAAGGGEIDRIPAQPRADTAQGVLDGRPVEQLHLALPLRDLPFGAVAHHLYALPHLAGTGGGQRAAVHHEFAAGTDDEAGVVGAMNGIGDCENST